MQGTVDVRACSGDHAMSTTVYVIGLTCQSLIGRDLIDGRRFRQWTSRLDAFSNKARSEHVDEQMHKLNTQPAMSTHAQLPMHASHKHKVNMCINHIVSGQWFRSSSKGTSLWGTAAELGSVASRGSIGTLCVRSVG